METTNSNTCSNCEMPHPSVGYFCGGCLTQFKCKSCDAILEKDYQGCTICGTPKDLKRENQSQPIGNNVNTFRLHETISGRTIEATFSDNVGKDLTGMIKDAYQSKIGNFAGNYVQLDKNSNPSFDEKTIDEKTIEVEATNYQQPSELEEELPSKTIKYPTLILLAINKLPKSEIEWVAVYSFYASNYGHDIFTRKDIINMHKESKRKNDFFAGNLSRNINLAVNAGYINPLHDGYAMMEEGSKKVIEIINRTTGHISKMQPKSSKKTKITTSNVTKEAKSKNSSSKSKVKNFKILSDIDFYPNNKQDLKKFYESFESHNDFERILLFTHYLKEILKIDIVTLDHIHTCFDFLELRMPEDLSQTFRSAKSKSSWIEKDDNGIFVTVKGRNKIKFWDRD